MEYTWDLELGFNAAAIREIIDVNFIRLFRRKHWTNCRRLLGSRHHITKERDVNHHRKEDQSVLPTQRRDAGNTL
jgi:hypothetical protein